jgi:single-strand DNA-binding protein
VLDLVPIDQDEERDAMSNETMVTLQGNVGGDVALRQAGEQVVANFRIACTPRRFQRKSGEWVDGETQWYTVNAWRHLGEHCSRSLRRGDPVVVQGRLTQRSYINKNNVEVTALEVEALLVGHDLSKGVSVFTRRPSQQPRPAMPGPEEATVTAA